MYKDHNLHFQTPRNASILYHIFFTFMILISAPVFFSKNTPKTLNWVEPPSIKLYLQVRANPPDSQNGVVIKTYIPRLISLPASYALYGHAPSLLEDKYSYHTRARGNTKSQELS